jgi:hypothetical protein
MNTKYMASALNELAEELDKLQSGEGDIRWLKTQGNLVKQAITALEKPTRKPMRSYRIVVDYTTNDEWVHAPETWDWHSLLAENVRETVSLVSVENIKVPEGHVEYFKEIDENV